MESLVFIFIAGFMAAAVLILLFRDPDRNNQYYDHLGRRDMRRFREPEVYYHAPPAPPVVIFQDGRNRFDDPYNQASNPKDIIFYTIMFFMVLLFIWVMSDRKEKTNVLSSAPAACPCECHYQNRQKPVEIPTKLIGFQEIEPMKDYANIYKHAVVLTDAVSQESLQLLKQQFPYENIQIVKIYGVFYAVVPADSKEEARRQLTNWKSLSRRLRQFGLKPRREDLSLYHIERQRSNQTL